MLADFIFTSFLSMSFYFSFPLFIVYYFEISLDSLFQFLFLFIYLFFKNSATIKTNTASARLENLQQKENDSKD